MSDVGYSGVANLAPTTLGYSRDVQGSNYQQLRGVGDGGVAMSPDYLPSALTLLNRLITSPAGIFTAGQGYLQTPGNLLTYSQDFTNAAWPTNNAPTVTAGTQLGPDGTMSAGGWTRTTVNPSYSQQLYSKSASALPFTFAAIAKQGTGRYLAVRMQGTYPNRVDAVFDLQTGVIFAAASIGGTFTNVAGSLAALGNGFYLCLVSGTTDSAVTVGGLVSSNSNGVQIDGTDSIATSSMVLYRAGLFAGTYTASQLAAMGGIPLTTAAAVPAVYTNASVYQAGSTQVSYGAELVTNGDFSNGTTGWLGFGAGGWAVSGGAATHTAGTYGVVQNSTCLVSTGKTYVVTFNVTLSAGDVKCYVAGTASATYTTSGEKQMEVVAGTNLTYTIALEPSTSFTGSIDNISVREKITSSSVINSLTAGDYTLSDGSSGLSAVDGSAGLVLDGMGAVGSELVVKAAWGAFASGVSYSTGTDTFTLTAVATTLMASNNFVVAGNTYQITFTVVSISAGTLSITLEGGTKKTPIASTAGTYTATLQASNTGNIFLYAETTPVTAVVTGVSVKQVTGIHATQATAGNRPSVRRGLLNLINRSDDLTNAAWQVQLTAGKSGQTITLPAPDDRVTNTLYSGPAAGAYTFAATLSGSGTVSLLGFNATDGNFGITRITLTATPTLYVTNMTATAANTTPFIWRRSATSDTATSVLVGSCGFFQGTLTAQQILDSGGIPLTTAAAASNPNAGRYSLEFDGTSDYIDQGSVPFQQADDRAVIVAFNARAAGTVYDVSGGVGTPLVGRIQLDGGGGLHAFFRDDASTLVDMSFALGFNVPVVVSYRVVAGVRVLRVNGVQRATNSTVLGATTVNIARIGAAAVTTPAAWITGTISQVLPLKGTFSDADMLTMERECASTLPNAPVF